MNKRKPFLCLAVLTVLLCLFPAYGQKAEVSAKPPAAIEYKSVSEVVYKVKLAPLKAVPLKAKPTAAKPSEQAEKEPPYSEEDLYYLSHVIYAEAGSDCCTDEHQKLVGMVVLNRVADPRFPNTIKEVVLQPGQYACVSNGSFYLEPSERAVQNAIAVFSGEVDCPANVIFQAEFPQGDGIYRICESSYSTTYFCYKE